ncbi:MAG TPA: hypothetical protein VES96_06975 [Nitrospiraceae bacterium]|nr:hypothetical protein [Nitrospiraceae bacterium]
MNQPALGYRLGMFAVVAAALAADPAGAIDVKLTMEEAKKSLAAGRDPMMKASDAAKPEEEIKKVLQQASMTTRVGADPEKEPCGVSAILWTKRYWLEDRGRKEATESKKQKSDVRMPDEKIQKYLDMPNMEVVLQLCGDDEYFAEGAQVTFQQGSKPIKPVDVSQAERGRKIEIAGKGSAYRARFSARFAYDSFDPNAKTKIIVYLNDGKTSNFDADFSKVK